MRILFLTPKDNDPEQGSDCTLVAGATPIQMAIGQFDCVTEQLYFGWPKGFRQAIRLWQKLSALRKQHQWDVLYLSHHHCARWLAPLINHLPLVVQLDPAALKLEEPPLQSKAMYWQPTTIEQLTIPPLARKMLARAQIVLVPIESMAVELHLAKQTHLPAREYQTFAPLPSVEQQGLHLLAACKMATSLYSQRKH